MDLRLEKVSEYICGNSFCDVGCDHGKLCAKALLNNKVQIAYGIDISDASLGKSRALKAKLGLENFHLLVGDGFEPVLDKDVDCGVICGIGSNETIGIIGRQIEFVKGLKRLILCPLKNTFTVREYLFKNGFTMDDEDMVFENGRYYNIFIVSSGIEGNVEDVDIYVGRRLIEKRHPLLAEWIESRIAAMKNNLSAYDNKVKTECTEKRDNMVRMLCAYERGIELCR